MQLAIGRERGKQMQIIQGEGNRPNELKKLRKGEEIILRSL